MHYDLIHTKQTPAFKKLADFFHLTLVSLEETKNLRIIEGKDDETIRKTLEHKQADILLDPHQNRHKDFMHFRNSGLNHTLCQFAHDNKISIGITPRYVSSSQELGRVMQNIRLCRKYRVSLVFLTLAKTPYQLRNPKDTLSFLLTLGMTGKEALTAVTSLEHLLKDKL